MPSTPIKKLSLISEDGTNEMRDIGALAENIIYDNTNSNLNAENTQAAIDEIVDNVSDILDTVDDIELVNALPSDASSHPKTLYLMKES